MSDYYEKKRKEEKSKPVNVCSVCLTNKYDTVFIPCGHVCCCSECAPRCNNICPICRCQAKSTHKIYLS